MFERFDKLADLQAVTAQSAEADTNVASREERGSSSFPTSHVRKVRRTVTVRGRGVRGYFPSKKAVGRATFESLIEEDALRVLEIARCVISYETQPLVLVLNDSEGQFTYTPDVAVRTHG